MMTGWTLTDVNTVERFVRRHCIPAGMIGKRERAVAVYCSEAGDILDWMIAGEGSYCAVSFDKNAIVNGALECGASVVFLAHNHPNGVAEASRADKMITTRIAHRLGRHGIELRGHIIVVPKHELRTRGIQYVVITKSSRHETHYTYRPHRQRPGFQDYG